MAIGVASGLNHNAANAAIYHTSSCRARPGMTAVVPLKSMTPIFSAHPLLLQRKRR
jgi:hypothetical protein